MFISDVHPDPPPQEEKEPEITMTKLYYVALDRVFSLIQNL